MGSKIMKYLCMLLMATLLMSCTYLSETHHLAIDLRSSNSTFYAKSNQKEVMDIAKNSLNSLQGKYTNLASDESNKLMLNKIAYLNLLCNYSGLYTVESFESISTKLGENSYKNELLIKYGKSLDKGFLRQLFDIPNKNIAEEVVVITDSTLFACDLQLNLVAALALFPKDNLEFKNFNDKFKSREFVGMSIEEFAATTNGNWGILINYVNFNQAEQQQYKTAGAIEFLFSIPDNDGKLFPLICEKIINNNLGELTNDSPSTLRVRPLSSTIAPIIISRDNYVLIYSSEMAISNIIQNAREDEYADKINKLNVPAKIEGNGFVYVAPQILPYISTLSPKFKSVSSSLNNGIFAIESLTILKNQTSSTLITQYSNFDFNQISTINSVIFPLALFEEQLKQQAQKLKVEKQNIALQQDCADKLKDIYKNYFLIYAQKHDGAYPSLAAFQESKQDCPTANKYYYIESFSQKSDKNIPILFDLPKNHGDVVNILFADGRVESFTIENFNSPKKVISYLHTVYHYEPQIFAQLLKLVSGQ